MNPSECIKLGLLVKVPYTLFIYYKLATFVPAVIGLYAIFHYSGSLGWTGGYLLVFFTHASAVFKLKCTHCTYYRSPGNALKCMWLWGVPKIFTYNPKPESAINKVYIPVSVSVVAFFPVYWLLNSLVFLSLYFASLAVLVLSLVLFACSKCTYFKCRFNRVPSKLRKLYLTDQCQEGESQKPI